MNQLERFKQGKIVSWVTIIANFFLTVAKVIIGLITNSVAVISDGIHSASDVLTTFIVLIGMKLSCKEADHDHPYGHEKYEPIMGIVLATILAIVAFYIGYEGIQKIFHPELVDIGTLSLFVTIASIIVKEWMYWYTLVVAKRIESAALMADAWHHRSDVFSSIGVLFGLLGAKWGIPQLEPISAVVVCLMILKVSWDIFKNSADQIIDKSAPHAAVAEIRQIAKGIDGVELVDSLKTRMHANKMFVDLEISVQGDISAEKAHEIAEDVHHAVEKVESVKHCMVHVNVN